MRSLGAHVLQQPKVAGASENIVGDARHDKVCGFHAGMAERVGVGDVPIDHLDAASPELSHDGGVEVDDHDLADEVFRFLDIALVLKLIEDGAGVPEEAEEDNRVALYL